MQANALPLAQAMINLSARANHESNEVDVAVLAKARVDHLFTIFGFVVTAVGLLRFAIVEYGVPPIVA